MQGQIMDLWFMIGWIGRFVILVASPWRWIQDDSFWLASPLSFMTKHSKKLLCMFYDKERSEDIFLGKTTVITDQSQHPRSFVCFQKPRKN